MQYYSVALNKRLFSAPVHAGLCLVKNVASCISCKQRTHYHGQCLIQYFHQNKVYDLMHTLNQIPPLVHHCREGVLKLRGYEGHQNERVRSNSRNRTMSSLEISLKRRIKKILL